MDFATRYQGPDLFMEEVALATIAETFGTPTYVYSEGFIKAQLATLQSSFASIPTQICYAVKANSNLAILRLMHDAGAGFDIVSGGELHRVLAAGGDPSKVIFSGVGKSVEEIDLALKLGIQCFNVESREELVRLSARAAVQQVVAPVSVRVNPDVDAQTHPYISTGLKENKFGVPKEQALAIYQMAAADAQLEVVGIDCHIGSQITQAEPLLEALTNLIDLVDQLEEAGIAIEHIDLGGGMGIRYEDETPLDTKAYGAAVAGLMQGRRQSIMLEPGRSLVANAGVLLTRVEYLKPSTAADQPSFAVVDAAMNDLIRPALYQAWHDVLPVADNSSGTTGNWHIVGPVCETGDFLAHNRDLTLNSGDLLSVASAGAYGMVQASNYNSRNRPAEVLVSGDTCTLIRRRETIDDQLQLERIGE